MASIRNPVWSAVSPRAEFGRLCLSVREGGIPGRE